MNVPIKISLFYQALSSFFVLISDLIRFLLFLLAGSGLFYLLPWDIALAGCGMLTLLFVLILYLRNRMAPTENWSQEEARSRKIFVKNKKEENLLIQQPKTVPTSPLKNRKKEAASSMPGIDSSIFTEFQKNIEKKTSLQDQQKQQAEANAKKEEIITAISNQGKSLSRENRAPVTNPYAQSRKNFEQVFSQPEEPSAVDIDLSEEIFSEEETPPPKVRTKKQASRKGKKKVPQSDEVLNFGDFKKGKKEQKSEIIALLEELEKCLQKDLYEDILTRIEIFEAENSNCEEQAEYGELLYYKAISNFHLKHYQNAKADFQKCFDHYIPAEHEKFAEYINLAVSLYTKNRLQKFGIPFLLTSLNYHRKKNDYEAMDELYEHVSAAYEQLGDTKRLIESLRNHISIRKDLKNYSGQLDLIDKLGKIFYDQGNQEGSNYCYQQSLRIKNEMESERSSG